MQLRSKHQAARCPLTDAAVCGSTRELRCFFCELGRRRPRPASRPFQVFSFLWD